MSHDQCSSPMTAAVDAITKVLNDRNHWTTFLFNGYSDGDYHMATKGVLSFVPIQWSTWCAGPVGVSFRVWGMEGGEGEKWAVQMSSNRELANLVCLWSVSVQSFRKVTSF